MRGKRARKEFAADLKTNIETYISYERGDTEPRMSFLIDVSQLCQVDLAWLMTGEPESSAGETDRKTIINRELLASIFDVVSRTYSEFSIHLPEKVLGRLSAKKYDEYIAMASDPDDEEERIALMNLLRTRLRKELQAQNAEPGTDKATA